MNRVGTLEYGPARVWEIQDQEHLRGIKFERRVVPFMHLFLESSFYSYFLPHRICSGIFFHSKIHQQPPCILGCVYEQAWNNARHRLNCSQILLYCKYLLIGKVNIMNFNQIIASSAKCASDPFRNCRSCRGGGEVLLCSYEEFKKRVSIGP